MGFPRHANRDLHARKIIVFILEGVLQHPLRKRDNGDRTMVSVISFLANIWKRILASYTKVVLFTLETMGSLSNIRTDH